MSTKNLGRLHKVDLREAWTSESIDFTPWLAQEDNLKLLGEVIGIELELESQEKEVGPFRADILCKNTANDSWVLIENQLARTDHSHLGQLITYAAGLNAVTIVWIAERFTQEHRAAMDWLNERTDEKINLFGLQNLISLANPTIGRARCRKLRQDLAKFQNRSNSSWGFGPLSRRTWNQKAVSCGAKSPCRNIGQIMPLADQVFICHQSFQVEILKQTIKRRKFASSYTSMVQTPNRNSRHLKNGRIQLRNLLGFH